MNAGRARLAPACLGPEWGCNSSRDLQLSKHLMLQNKLDMPQFEIELSSCRSFSGVLCTLSNACLSSTFDFESTQGPQRPYGNLKASS